MLQQQSIGNSLKRCRDVADCHTENKSKTINSCSRIAFDFKCSAYYRGKILDFQLSHAFHKFKYTVLFFCNYDFTEQSKEDFSEIQKRYIEFVENGALPIALTQDRVQIHKVYATPGGSSGSLAFEPLYAMVSDSTDRLISRFYNNIDAQRSVIIINHHLQIVFTQTVPDSASFPMDTLLLFLK